MKNILNGLIQLHLRNRMEMSENDSMDFLYPLFVLFCFEIFRYVPLYYTDGDICEATKAPRVVEVKLRLAKR